MLPERALTNATRLRWWQPFSLLSGLVRSSAERAQWALDNILVGGSDINPSTLLDTFDDGDYHQWHCDILKSGSVKTNITLSY